MLSLNTIPDTRNHLAQKLEFATLAKPYGLGNEFYTSTE